MNKTAKHVALLTLLSSVATAQAAPRPPGGVTPSPAPLPGTQLKIITPTQTCNTGPVPQVVLQTRAVYVGLQWTPVAGATQYQINRAVPGQSPTRISPAGFGGVAFWDAVPDTRYAYQYSVTAVQANGCYGSTSVMAPGPFTNPNTNWVHAVRTAPATVNLSWHEVPGAVGYRLYGGSFPNGGLLVSGESFVEGTFPASAGTPSTVPAAAGGWDLQLTSPAPNLGPGSYSFNVFAVYPGNFADYAHPASASVPGLPPSISDASPPIVLLQPTTPVLATITGQNFVDVQRVLFCIPPAGTGSATNIRTPAFTVVSATTITANVECGGAGGYVQVITAWGQVTSPYTILNYTKLPIIGQ